MPHDIDNDGNQITHPEKWLFGAILIAATCTCFYFIIGLWPDRIPAPNEGFQSYCEIKLFDVKVVTLPQNTIDLFLQSGLYKQSTDSTKKAAKNKPAIGNPENKNQPVVAAQTAEQKKKAEEAKAEALKKHVEQVKIQQAQQQQAKLIDSITSSVITKYFQQCCKFPVTEPLAASLGKNVIGMKGAPLTINPENFKKLKSLNTLILLLVILGGFLGNLIHIMGSFGDFIGNGQFKRSWSLWYFTRPFIAAGLAVAVYFALIGGFLSVNSNANSVNLIGVMTVSILVGLFTDRTALKLGEVFNVIFRPQDNRADQMTADPIAILVTPMTIQRGTTVPLTIMGQNFVKDRLILTINDIPVEMVVSPTNILVNYQVPDLPLNIQSVTLKLQTVSGTMLIEKELNLQP